MDGIQEHMKENDKRVHKEKFILKTEV